MGQLVGTSILPRLETCNEIAVRKGVVGWANNSVMGNNISGSELGRTSQKANKLLTIAVVKGMLSINDDTNAETHTMTIIAIASCKGVNKTKSNKLVKATYRCKDFGLSLVYQKAQAEGKKHTQTQ